MRSLFHSICFFCLGLILTGVIRTPDVQAAERTPSEVWVDSLMSNLTLEERIGQLFMIAVYSNWEEKDIKFVTGQVKKYNLGGVIFMQGGPYRQARLTNHLQEASKIPLLVGIDGEWGLAMRLDSTQSFPRQMVLGAVHDSTAIYDMGLEIGRQCRRLGVHINFAPVLDVNNNPANPVINSRSFGENPQEVAKRGIAYMKGLQDAGVIAVGKHFPGHGDTSVDSHKALPTVSHTRDVLDSLDFEPFRQAVSAGMEAVMVGHLQVPSLDATSGLPATLSSKVVNGVLRGEMGFGGLVFTDAMNMKGVSRNQTSIYVRAILAGNDVLLFPGNIAAAVRELRNAVEAGNLPQELINARCRKILLYKHKMGLDQFEPISLTNLDKDLNTSHSEWVKDRIKQEALTLVKNRESLIPFGDLSEIRIASVSLGTTSTTAFQKRLSSYANVKHFNLPRFLTPAQVSGVVNDLQSYDVVVVGVHGNGTNPRSNYGVTDDMMGFLKYLAPRKKVVLSLFANPYALGKFNPVAKDLAGILVGYSNDEVTQDYAAQLLFGGISAKGKLPVTVGSSFPQGAGIETPVWRLRYSLPEAVEMDPVVLKKVDSIANDAIAKGATPGCQILVARNGAVVLNKGYGYHDLDKKKEVRKTDLYDIASVTKILTTVPEIMRLYESGLLSLDGQLSDYLAIPDSSNKRDILISDLLYHQAGLQPFIPFWLEAFELDSLDGRLFSHRKSSLYSVKLGNGIYMNPNIPFKKWLFTTQPDSLHQVPVAQDMYICNSFVDTIWSRVDETSLKKAKHYRYSDLSFMYLTRVAETLNQKKIDYLVYEHLFRPLGISQMRYRPLDFFSLERIVPTEKDDFFRHQLVHGYVHDQTAAMEGGVSGHAGLFGCANEVAKIMQMYMNGGSYGGRRFFDPLTLQLFTQKGPNEENRRGLGFDKAEKRIGKPGPTCDQASASSFGHTGFTGCYAWSDPDEGLVYVFLSNRIHPHVWNNKLIKMDVRTKIQEVLYKAIIADDDKEMGTGVEKLKTK